MEKKCKIIYMNNFIYILSDDEIKEGDWCHNFRDNNIEQFNSNIINLGKGLSKIITTTNSLLNLPQLSQQFIEKYIESYNKGEIITDVLVEYEHSYNESWIRYKGDNKENPMHFYKLKINPKDNTITIKKLKDSWNREEVANLIKLFANNYSYASNDIGYNKWIQENL